MNRARIIEGDCRDVLAGFDAHSFDSIVTDPPYGLGFMGSRWDRDLPDAAIFEELIRIAKPGAHLVAFGAPRTFHRLAVAIEDAGWDIRDTISWVYGSGMPKSLNVAKALDAHIRTGGSNTRRLRQTEQETGGEPYTLRGRNNGMMGEARVFERRKWSPVTDEGKTWQGWGTALKPAWEPIIIARAPFEGSVASQILANGVAAMNVDACRICDECGDDHAMEGLNRCADCSGRYPANFIHDDSEETLALLPEEARRFFYCPKASREERSRSCSERNSHPTVKPLALMAYLCRLVTPKGGRVLDPFCGSGSTGVAALRENLRFVGIERDPEYVRVARERIG